jgi:glutaminyl-peptide cyclotransferase
MGRNLHKYYILLPAVILFALTLSCSGRPGKEKDKPAQRQPAASEEPAAKLVRIISPADNAGFKLRQPVKLVLGLEDKSVLPDSASVFFNGKYVTTLKSGPWEFSIPSSLTVTTGRKSLKVNAYKGGKLQNSATLFVVIFSDIVPAKNSYRVINTYPHDRNAFTQGLVYDNGVLFEGTGQESSSSLREVELATGKVIRQHNLDEALFGEGITLYHDLIYEVTWKNKTGFVYNKSDFKLINKIFYQTEGWGLTTVNDKLVMSDGTNVLYFYEPEMFTVVSKIEVYDNGKKVDNLNELEFINGEIWANVWMTDLIARIDPVSGKVLAYIDMKNILPKSDRDTDTDVLNGIAYDAAGKRIFVTGKRWPKLFEIRITE